MRVVRPVRLVALSISLLLAPLPRPQGQAAGITSAPARRRALSALNDKVDSLLNVSPTALYAGGTFTSAGGDPAARMIARWDGAGWHPIGPTAISTAAGAGVEAIAYDSVTGRVFVGGNYVDAGGTAAADFVAYWNGFAWQSPCNLSPEGNVTSLQIIGRALYVGGAFSPPAGLPNGQSLLACESIPGPPRRRSRRRSR